MKITILKPKHFCLFRNKEVGIATSEYAANRFRDDGSDLNAYLYESKYKAFGWIDHHGKHYVDSKYKMSRPDENRILEELKNYPDLFDEALTRDLIEIK